MICMNQGLIKEVMKFVGTVELLSLYRLCYFRINFQMHHSILHKEVKILCSDIGRKAQSSC